MTSHTCSTCCGISSPASSTGTLMRSRRRVLLPMRSSCCNVSALTSFCWTWSLLRRQGLDLLKRVRDLGVNAPVLMMSGDYESRKEADAPIEGAFGYLHKP